jgi:60 kDa SS-A/Ro ribonucleoprotein
MPDALSNVSTRKTPQSKPADPRQVENSAGGFTFTLDPMARLRRFLMLGVDGGTYYTSAPELAEENANVVLELAASDPKGAVDVIVEISQAGRAPRQNPTIFALAVIAAKADEDGRAYALAALPKVARTGTHLFLFAGYVENFRGWGRGLRRAIADWYLQKDVNDLAYQMVKYRQREGWSHRDLLRLAHPKTQEAKRRGLFDWACGRSHAGAPELVYAWEKAQKAKPDGALDLIAKTPLSWEMLPDELLSEPSVWRALINKGIPQTALIRQLPRLTRLGLFKDAATRQLVVGQIQDPERLKAGRVHPISLLVAAKTYATGQGRGQTEWTPERRIVDALDAAFYAAFQAVEPTGKRLLLALDVSGSMDWDSIGGFPLTPREASAAIALVTAATEPSSDIVGFSHELVPLTISPRQRLDDVCNVLRSTPVGGTDCAQPMLYAIEEGLEIDTFVVYTDNETWAGGIHPHQALRQYREKTGIPAKLVVVGMTSHGFTIADPNDSGMLDIVGFDSACPALISDFARDA